MNNYIYRFFIKNQGIHLSWIVVKDFNSALKFYTEVAGFTLKEKNLEYGWAELSGENGSLLGIAQEGEGSTIKAGSNAITTLAVKDINEARDYFEKKGAKLIGAVEEIPGHVKLQTFSDEDGNIMQLVQKV